MKINSFSFSSNSQNLHIEEIYFDNLNLLVGASGVGKTRILKALHLICNIAQGKTLKIKDVRWSINFSHLGKTYKWNLEALNSIDDSFSGEQEQAEILDERIIKCEGNTEIDILYRTKEDSKLDGKGLPKLKRTESAISLLAEEESIIPVAEAFKRFIFNETPQSVIVSIGFDPINLSILSSTELGKTDPNAYLKKFKATSINTPTVLNAFFLQNFLPHVFDEMKEVYTEIFPSVKDVRITVNRGSDNRFSLIFEIKENSSESWITQLRISSGMYRTLTYLTEIFAATEDSVVMIDEFENSLGINCMPQLTEFILDKSSDLQFILTSHHPYIINNIPWETWQLVSRTNGTIRSRKAIDIPTLNTASSLDKFTQLINLFEYEDEIA